VVLHSLHHHDGIIHDKAYGQHQTMSAIVLMEKPSKGKNAKVATRDTGTAKAGMSVARKPAGR